jgi:hypothetical protein
MQNHTKKFLLYLYNNYIGNFLGFVIGMASTRLVAQFFTTRSIKNPWGLTAHKTVVDKQTFSAMQWMISILIGFIVFEIISKWIKFKMDAMLEKHRSKFPTWLVDPAAEANAEKDIH